MRVGFDIHWTILVWIAGSIVSLVTLLVSFLLTISFIPEIGELFTKLRNLVNVKHDKS
jgi:hypothetical protein